MAKINPHAGFQFRALLWLIIGVTSAVMAAIAALNERWPAALLGLALGWFVVWRLKAETREHMKDHHQD